MATSLAIWTGPILLGWLWGTLIRDAGTKISINAPPVFGEWDLQIDWSILIPVTVALALVWAMPALARSLSWRALLAAVVVLAAAWPLALALTEGLDAIVTPLENRNDYLGDVGKVSSPGAFLDSFTERIDDFSTHVRGHPPGFLLALWVLGEIGLGGSSAAAALILIVAASTAAAAMLALRSLAGERAARRVAPFLVLMPGAVWIATTADALFMGVGAWAVAVTVIATRAQGRRSDLLAAAGGLAFGVTLMLSYGLLLLGAIPIAVAIADRRIRPPAIAAAGTLAVLGAFWVAGFFWPDGLETTRGEYMEGISRTRPYGYFLLNNLAAFALAAGPATAIGLGLLRDRRTWLLVGGALLAMALADLSGMSKGEVERIWLPFLPWVVLATRALPAAMPAPALLLAGQAVTAIVIQVSVRMPW